jgi:DNA-directed RNA polymerase specialized sigma subunit
MIHKYGDSDIMEDSVVEEWSAMHPAERAAMYKGGRVSTGNSDEIILRDLRKKVFSVPLLPQKQIQVIFVSVDSRLHNAMLLLISNCSSIRKELMRTIFKVAASNTYGKNLFEKSADLKEEIGRRSLQDTELQFLQRSAKLLSLMIQLEAGKPVNPIELDEALSEAQFIRGVYEELLEEFAKHTKDYQLWHWDAFHAKISQQDLEYSQHLEKILGLEKSLGLNQFAFGIVAIVNETLSFFYKQRSIIIGPYLRTVYRAARTTAKNVHQMLDNFQNGSIGLVRAVSCYSYRRPTTFSSVAKWWVKQMMLLSIKEDANFVKLPVSTWQSFTKLEKIRSAMASSEEDFEKLAKAAHTSEKRVKAVYSTIKVTQVYSLNKAYDQDERMTLEDIITDDAKLGPEVNTFAQELREYCQTAQLTKVERLVLALKHGMLDILPVHELKPDVVINESIAQNCARLGYHFTPQVRKVKT